MRRSYRVTPGLGTHRAGRPAADADRARGDDRRRRVPDRRVGRLVQLRPHRGLAQSPGAQGDRRHGAGDDDSRRGRSHRVHDLQGAAHRGSDREDRAEPDQSGRLGRRPALLRPQRRGRCPCRCGGGQELPGGAPRRGGQHDHAAARPAELPQPRQDLPPEAQGSDPRGVPREDVREERDSRGVPEQGVLRRRPVRGRGRFARIPRQAVQRSDGRGSGAARGLDSVAFELRPDGQPDPRGRAAQCRAPGHGRLRRHRSGDRRAGQELAREAGQRSRDQRIVRPLFQGTGPPRARGSIRLGARVPRRASRVHDDGPGAAAVG